MKLGIFLITLGCLLTPPLAHAAGAAKSFPELVEQVQSPQPELFKITQSPLLKKLIDQAFALAQDPLICPLKATFDGPLDEIYRRDTTSLCRKRFGKVPTFIEMFPGRNGMHEIYLVFGGRFPWKSWTDAQMNTYLFVDNHVDSMDLLRSLMHELSLLFDVKYDATMWGMNFGLEPELLEAWHLEFYRLWMKSPQVRVGLSVIRADAAEQKIFTGRSSPVNSCYEHLLKGLGRQAPFAPYYMKTDDTHASTSFSTVLARALRERGFAKQNSQISESELEAWVKNLSSQDQDEQKCLFLVSPVLGTSPNFFATGPRPGFGDGLAIPETPTGELLERSETFRKSLRDELGAIPQANDLQLMQQLERIKEMPHGQE